MTEFFQVFTTTLASLFVIVWTAIFLAKLRIFRVVEKICRYPAEPVEDKVSVIVPVRNEEKTIKKCIESLLSQKGFSKEVIVVDDNSTDSTWEVAKSFMAEDVKLVRVGETPAGWVGKTWACNIGYENSTGEWLLFTDADTEFSDDVVARALNAAKSLSVDVLTLYPRFRFSSLLHKTAMPILLTGLYFLGRPHGFSKGRSAFAFGSFILIRRQGYQKIGGHSAVRNAVLEDRAIAVKVLKAGLRPFIIDATEKLTSSWNDDSKSLWNGMLRLFIPLSLKAGFKQFLAYFSLAAACFTIPLTVFLLGNYLAGFISYAAAALALGHEAKHHAASVFYGLLWPLGVAAVAAALLVAFYKSRTRPTVSWRGRKYFVEMGEHHEAATVC
ncbi:MAG: glycosyltransferase family 2 protein [Candidatus Caldarchaeum sp.]